MKIPGKLSALGACLLLCLVLSAQKKTVPGYYITLQSDTVRGTFPGYAQWNKNPSEVNFVAAGATTPLLLTPHSIRKFVVNGFDEYISYTGSRLVNPIDDDVLFNEKTFIGLNDSIQQVATFLRLAARTTGGDVYVLNDAKRINFFYKADGQPLVELRYKRAFIQNQFSEMADFRQQLQHLFAEAIAQKKLTVTLERLPYTEEELSSFFQKLFPATKQKESRPQQATAWVVSAGASLNMVSVKTTDPYYSIPESYAPSLSPLISVGFIVPVDRNFGRYFFYPQVKLFRYKNTGEVEQGTFVGAYTYQTTLAALAQVSGGVNVINQGNHRLFLAAGFGLLAQAGSKEVKQRYAASNRAPYLDPAEIKLPLFTYGIDATAGVELNGKIVLTASYLIPTNIGNFPFYTPKLSGLQLSAGYKLK